jgi:hypothetical protein
MHRRRLLFVAAAALASAGLSVTPLETEAQLDADARRRRRRGRKRRGGKRRKGGGFVDKDCSDFPTQRAAQNFVRKEQQRLGVRDAHGLDADNDGVACESNPR